MADKEFTQICKEILGVSKKLEKIEPEELRKIKADIEQISATIVAHKASFDASKEDFDGKYSGITEIINTFDTLKAQIEEVLKSGTINDSTEALISTFSSKKIVDLLNEAKGVIDEKFSTIHKNGITPWNSTLEYPAGAISVLNGKLYQAKSENTNKNPSENKEIWSAFASKEWSEQTFLKKDDKIDAYTKQESDDKFALKNELTDGLPIGAYLSYPSQKTIPAGFLIADGRSLKKSEYPELFNVLGYIYGGSGENFNLPNFADGKFMRGIGGKAAPLGTAQQDELKSHIHNVSVNTDSDGNSTATLARGKNEINNNESGFIKPTGGNETRPYNMAVVVIIKAKNVNTPTAGQIDKTIMATEAKAGVTKLKNAITAKQEDAAVTEKAVAEAIEANKSIGINQTWQDVKDQRQAGVTYTNTTGRPIFVIIKGAVNFGIPNAPVLVDDVVVGEILDHTKASSSFISFIVPQGSKYKADFPIGVSAITFWVELR